jgi:7,8-dihydropterin-6-yl-methyl-4-(beta-D-ribofuranosyl)aminobenzene 5'-phosphate synthase
MIKIKHILIGLLSLFIFTMSVSASEIHNAARQGDLAAVKNLITKNPELVNRVDSRNSTPLHFAAHAGHKEVVELLITKGAKQDIKDEDGHIPLHWAARGGRKNTAEFLIAKGSDVNARGNNRRTPLFFAAGSGNIDLCKLLIEKGAVINVKNKFKRTPLHYAIWRNQKEIAAFLVEKGADVNTIDTPGNALLHYLCEDGLKDMVEFLVAKGANITIKNIHGYTPLHLAANYGHTDVVEFLISKGIDANTADDSGDTPLHGAAWGGYKKTVESLLAQGAKVNAKNKDGTTPLDNASRVGHKEVVELLKSKGGTLNTHRVKHVKTASLPIKSGNGEKNMIKITILYDNYVYAKGTKAEWGFSCLIQGTEKTILFDTGTVVDILMHNIDQMKVNLKEVDQVVISHIHGDHTGGLFAVLEKKPNIPVYVPYSFPYNFVRRVEKAKGKVITVNEPLEVCENVFLTGEMGDDIKEHSLIIDTEKGLVVITGCSHPGIVNIVKKAKEILKKKVYFVFGGFHLGRHSDKDVKKIIKEFKEMGVIKCGPTHCTGERAIQLFREAYKENYVKIGTGRVLEINK